MARANPRRSFGCTPASRGTRYLPRRRRQGRRRRRHSFQARVQRGPGHRIPCAVCPPLKLYHDVIMPEIGQARPRAHIDFEAAAILQNGADRKSRDGGALCGRLRAEGAPAAGEVGRAAFERGGISGFWKEACGQRRTADGYHMADCYAFAGQNDRALDLLEQAVARHGFFALYIRRAGVRSPAANGALQGTAAPSGTPLNTTSNRSGE
jgi:hypothetical protein